MTANTQLMEAQQADGAGVELVSETTFYSNLTSPNNHAFISYAMDLGRAGNR